MMVATQDLDVSGSNHHSVTVTSSIGGSGKVNPGKVSLQLDPRTATSNKRANLCPPAQSRSDDIRVLTAGARASDFESAVVSASVSVSSTDKHAKTPGGQRRQKLTRKGTVEDINR
jgi:hypothetical protein